MIYRQAKQFPISHGSFGLFTNSAKALLSLEHLFILAITQIVLSLQPNPSLITLLGRFQFGRFGDLLLAKTVAFAISFSAAFSAMTIGITSGGREAMSIFTFPSFGSGMWRVCSFEMFARSCFEHLGIRHSISAMPFLKAAFAVTVMRFADFSKDMFAAPTSSWIGTKSAAFSCSHCSMVSAFNGYVNGDVRNG